MDVLDVTETVDVEADAPEQQPVAETSARLLASAGGILLLVGAVLASFGIVLFAPVGMWVANTLAKRRGRALGRWALWFAGSGTIAVVVFLVTTGVFVVSGTNPIASVQRSMDSTTVEQREKNRPAWMERMSPPGTRERSNAMEQTMAKSPAMVAGTLLIGGVIAVEVFAVIIGTCGWGAIMLIHFASKGRWLA